MDMRPKTAITIAAVLLLCIAANVTVCASSFDVDKLLQFLAWSANTSDYNMTVDIGILERPFYKLHNGRVWRIREGNPMFAGNPEYCKTITDIKNAIIEIAPDVLPKPLSTMALLAIIVTNGGAVTNNNRLAEMMGEPIRLTFAYRHRW